MSILIRDNPTQQITSPVTQTQEPTFERLAGEILAEATSTFTQRGQEYRDSWDYSNLATPFLDFVYQYIATRQLPAASQQSKRLVAAASLCDVKLSRVVGGYKKDTFVDLINYIAFLTGAIEELEAK
jgi:hypothetical protein